MGNSLLHTNVKGKFIVSTIYRQCSSMLGGWYFESMVFDIDSKGAMLSIVDQDESRTEGGAIRAHQAWVRKYAEKLAPIAARVEAEHDDFDRLSTTKGESRE